MNKIILRIRAVDRKFFDVIKSGEKTIETRAATDKFRLEPVWLEWFKELKIIKI